MPKSKGSKVCFKCGIEKSIDEFYTHPRMADKHLGKCRTCTRRDTSERKFYLIETDPAWAERERERHREKWHRLNATWRKPSRKYVSLQQAKWAAQYPEKKKATARSRHMPRLAGGHLHHWSYRPEHWKDVVELTTQDHYTVHRFMVYDAERMQYRTTDGVLLDTREAAETYYRTVLAKAKTTAGAPW